MQKEKPTALDIANTIIDFWILAIVLTTIIYSAYYLFF